MPHYPTAAFGADMTPIGEAGWRAAVYFRGRYVETVTTGADGRGLWLWADGRRGDLIYPRALFSLPPDKEPARCKLRRTYFREPLALTRSTVAAGRANGQSVLAAAYGRAGW